MSCFDSESFASFIFTIPKALCRFFCAPVYDEIKFAEGALVDPQSLDEDSYKLSRFLADVVVMSSSDEIEKWICEAQKNLQQIHQLWRQEISESTSCLCADACSRYNLHRKIKRTIALGERIKHPPLRLEAVQHIHAVPQIEVGTSAEWNLEQVMDMLNDDDVGCVVVWGPGGVGKTTLVKALYDKLAMSKSPFSLVRLIELQADDGESEVQEAIAKSLRLNMEKGIEGRIRNTLQSDKFLLILDNLWKSIDLPKLGIPKEVKGSKIVLTTRIREVSTEMDAKEMKMGYLTDEEAWRLFAEKAGEVVNDEFIKPLAKRVCTECGYLPLALVRAGSAMRGVTTIREWQNAVNSLQNSASVDDPVESGIYKSLKVSYDLLDDTLKACFLYCSLYPKGYSIYINELIECWTAEKLIDEPLLHTRAYNKGLSLIERLKESNLLQQGTNGKYWESETVRMHDATCDFARRIGEYERRSIVDPVVTSPEEVESFSWISFVYDGKIKLPKYWEDYCSATTILLRGSNYKENMVSTNFLKCFRAAKVVNLEQVHSFAASHLQLEKLQVLILRDCSDIKELPIAGDLKILDLSNNIYLRNTPRGTEELSNLKVLNLSCTPSLKRIDAGTIFSLKLLEVLNMCESGYLWPIRRSSESEVATLLDLAGLRWLREVYLELAETDGTYEECSWLERLECFYISYDQPVSSRYRRKTLNINMRSLDTEVGSFILHANELIMRHVKNVNEIFANFSSTDQSSSKLKSLEIGNSVFRSSSAATIPMYIVYSNVEELYLDRNRLVSSLPYITSALGANFSKLRSLRIRESVVVVFSKDDQHIVLPQLKSLSVYGCREEVAFDCGPAVIQAIAPNLGTLELYNSERLERLCNCDSKEKWISLKKLKVINCRRLKNIPLMPFIDEIRGSIEWWTCIVWQSEETKMFMNMRFNQL